VAEKQLSTAKELATAKKIVGCKKSANTFCAFLEKSMSGHLDTAVREGQSRRRVAGSFVGLVPPDKASNPKLKYEALEVSEDFINPYSIL